MIPHLSFILQREKFDLLVSVKENNLKFCSAIFFTARKTKLCQIVVNRAYFKLL